MLCHDTMTKLRTPGPRLCHDTMTKLRTPRLGLCHNILDSEAWAVSQHSDKSKNTEARAVLQHIEH